MKISIITVVRNNQREISGAIESVLGQTHGEIEYIIIDGASTDGSQEIIKRYNDRIHTFLSEPDNGLYDALNKGILLATGEVIGLLHSDDFYPRATVLEEVNAVFESTGTDSVYGDLQYVAKDNPERVIRHWKSCSFRPGLLQQGWMPPHPTFFVRRKIYEAWGRFNPDYQIAADYDLMLRFLGVQKISAAYLPSVLVKMRVGGASNRSLTNLLRKSCEDYRALRRNGIGGGWALFRKNVGKLHQFFPGTRRSSCHESF